METSYFHRVARETPTKLWINNPTREETEKAIDAGAISCTTNPTFASRMIREEPEYTLKIIDSVIKRTKDDGQAAETIQRELALPVLNKFLPLYERNPGVQGVVSIQGNPHEDDDPEFIVEEAHRNRIAKNFIAKIPATKAGVEAIEVLIKDDVPVIATEIMSIAQAIYACELYERISRKSGRTPPFYITHISGIFDEHLANVVKRDGIDIAPEVLREAGCAVARKQYRIFKERGYQGAMLLGGARGTHHFTEMVGGDVHVTINWSTADELIKQGPPVISRMKAEVSQSVIDELNSKIPDFRKAYNLDGLSLEEFKDYGPVQHFRNNFVKGWDILMEKIKERRKKKS